ncbi:plasmid stabilization protein StbA [Candidatus Hamiltonella defensa]|nr:plasmid stabilization protein StbA [Candidatus Hamiltonella defensa]
MKPKSIRAAIQMMLPEVEEMLSLGVSRENVFKVVSERFHIVNVNVRSFDTALYRARVKRSKLEKFTTLSCRKKENQNNTHSQEIIGKEFFEKINDSFDPNKFIDKY